MVETDDIELWDEWYLHYMYEKIKKEIEKREERKSKTLDELSDYDFLDKMQDKFTSEEWERLIYIITKEE